MRDRKRWVGVIAAVMAVVSLGAWSVTAGAESQGRLRQPEDPTLDAQRYRLWHDTTLWNDTATYNYVVAANFAAAVERARAEEAAAAEAAAAAAAARKSVAPTGRGGGGAAPASNVGGSCGGATNGADRFIGAESGGNPNARNASGAWGCYQIMPGTWQSSCSDLGAHGSAGTDAQAQCASRLPSSSWAATGG